MWKALDTHTRKSKFNLFRELIRHMSRNSSIHGMQFIGNFHISKPERCLWLVIVMASVSHSYNFIKTNLDHYHANPTVVTIEKDFRKWENPFPACTACFLNKMDIGKAKTYIEAKWGIREGDNQYSYYLNFVEIVSNLTYKNLHLMNEFKNDENLINTDWIQLIEAVHPQLDGVLVTFENKMKPEWQFVITELGLCFTLNSRFAKLMLPNSTFTSSVFSDTWKTTQGNLKCHYLNGLCYARYDSDPNRPIWYHIHSHLEMIHATSETPTLVRQSEEYEVNYKLAETYSLNDIRYLTPQQRKCRFEDEPLTNNVPVYSNSICTMECRYRLAMEKCGCRPFFYLFLGGKICNLHGLLCLAKISYLFNNSTEAFGCSCPQPCNLMVYLKQVPKVTQWAQEFFDQRITFRWGLLPPTTKYHRKILFGFQELIVSFGGALSLFLGLSVISCFETVYLISESFYHSLQKAFAKKTNGIGQ